MLDTLYRLIQKYLSPKSLEENVFVPVVESNRKLCLNLIKELQEYLGNTYDPLKANAIFIIAPTSNITKFLNALKLINVRVKAGRAIEATDCNWTHSSMTLDHFFISDDGYYIDSDKILELIDQAQQLCESMADSEGVEYGTPEHNSRMLTKTFVSLKSILSATLEVFKK